MACIFRPTDPIKPLSSNSYLFVRAPQWKYGLRCIEPQPPIDLQSWLCETGSLTKRLRNVYGSNLTVQLLFHRWKPAFAEECRALHVPHHRYQLIREVLLSVNSQPLVLARTVLPQQTIRIAHRNLSHLGTRPLGEVIFAYPDLELRQRHYSSAKVSIWSNAVQQHYQMLQHVWGRRTLYAIQNEPLLVSEFFLPAIANTAPIQTP